MLTGGLANKGLNWMFDQFGGWATDWLMAGFSKFVEQILNAAIEMTGSFWDEPVISIFLDFSMTVSFVVLIMSMLFFLVEIAHQSGRINWVMVYSNFVKVTVFILFNRYIGLASIRLSEILTTSLNLSMDAPRPSVLIAGITSGTIILPAAVLFIILLIAYVAFFIMSMLRNGMMFVQILSSSCYIPGILNGDTAQLGDWIRQTVAISVTFVLQYYMFYLGLTYFATSLFICLTCWITMFFVPKILEKFGYSSGAGGVLSSAGSIVATGMSFVK